jgi:hypothetical protein
MINHRVMIVALLNYLFQVKRLVNNMYIMLIATNPQGNLIYSAKTQGGKELIEYMMQDAACFPLVQIKYRIFPVNG